MIIKCDKVVTVTGVRPRCKHNTGAGERCRYSATIGEYCNRHYFMVYDVEPRGIK